MSAVNYTAADVSWISKIPSESEWIRRGANVLGGFTVESIEVVEGLQRVALKGP